MRANCQISRSLVAPQVIKNVILWRIFRLHLIIRLPDIMKTDICFTSRLETTPNHSAAAQGSGDLRVLATPQMVALMENAAMNAAKDLLPEGSTTVGAMISISHLRPTAIGKTISATATLLNAEGRKLTFDVTASDDKGIIGEGKHVRYIVDTQKFLEKL